MFAFKMFLSWASIAALYFAGLVAADGDHNPWDTKDTPVGRDPGKPIDAGLFMRFEVMAQYVAAAYCLNLHNSWYGSQPFHDPNGQYGTWDPSTKSWGSLRCSVANDPKLNSQRCPSLFGNRTYPARDVELVYEWSEDRWGADVGGYIALDHVSRAIIFVVRGFTLDRTMRGTGVRDDYKGVSLDIADCPKCRTRTMMNHIFRTIGMDRAPREEVRRIKKERPDYRLFVAGHAWGGAYASLFALRFAVEGFEVGFYSFGSPRVFNAAAAEYFEKRIPEHYRITNRGDRYTRSGRGPTAMGPIEKDWYHIRPEYIIDPMYSNPDIMARRNAFAGQGYKNLITEMDVLRVEGWEPDYGNRGADHTLQSWHNTAYYLQFIDQCENWRSNV